MPRKINVSKPAAAPAKPATAAPAVIVAKPAAAPTAPATAPAAPAIRGLTRAHRVIDAMRYPFERDSDPDMLYLAFFATFAKRNAAGTFVLGETLHTRPASITINNNPARLLRLVKAGYFTVTGNGAQRVATATPKATAHKLYSGATARAPD